MVLLDLDKENFLDKANVEEALNSGPSRETSFGCLSLA